MMCLAVARFAVWQGEQGGIACGIFGQEMFGGLAIVSLMRKLSAHLSVVAAACAGLIVYGG